MATLLGSLGEGEAQAISLALECGIDTVLIDESAARDAARRAGLKVTGVIGVLLEAKAAGRIASFREELNRLVQDEKFRISHSLFEEACAAANE